MSTTRARPNKNPILAGELRDDDWDDPFGTAMGWLGSIADLLWDADPNEVPAAWQYAPGMGGPDVPRDHENEVNRITFSDVPYSTARLWEYLHDVEVTDPDTVPENLLYWQDPGFQYRIDVLKHAGTCLSRYINWCRLAGRDY